MTVPNFLNLTNLTLNDVHTFVGGSSGTSVSLNDSDIRGITNTHPEFDGGGLNTSSGTQISMSQLRGASDIAVSAGSYSATTPFTQWGDEDCTTSATFTPTSSCSVVATLQTANNRVQLVSTSGNSVDGFTQQTTFINYTNCEGNSVDFQIKCTSNATIVDAGSNSSITGTFNSFISMTNGSAVTFAWQAVANSSNPTARVRATNPVSFSFRVRFTVGSDNLFFPTSTTSVDSSGRLLDLQANHGGSGGGGGAGGGGGGV